MSTHNIITAGEYAAMQARGEVAAHFAAETVRAEYPVSVAEFSGSLTDAYADFRSRTNTPNTIAHTLMSEPYEDAVFSDEEDGGEDAAWPVLQYASRWPHVPSVDVLDAASLMDATPIAADDVIEALDVLEIWSAACE